MMLSIRGIRAPRSVVGEDPADYRRRVGDPGQAPIYLKAMSTPSGDQLTALADAS